MSRNFLIFFGSVHEWKIIFGQQKLCFGAIGVTDRAMAGTLDILTKKCRFERECDVDF